MSLIFEWGEKKTEQNLKKHGISFAEATTIFGDKLSLTIPDPLHSINEERFVIIGHSFKNRLIVVVHTERGIKSVLLVQGKRREKKGKYMKKVNKRSSKNEMLDEYDFSSGVRGKYAKPYQKGSNVVVLDPDVAEVFSDKEYVNESLRALAKIIKQKRKKA